MEYCKTRRRMGTDGESVPYPNPTKKDNCRPRAGQRNKSSHKAPWFRTNDKTRVPRREETPTLRNKVQLEDTREETKSGALHSYVHINKSCVALLLHRIGGLAQIRHKHVKNIWRKTHKERDAHPKWS